MIRLSTLFWLSALLSAIWNAWTFINYSIRKTFHPMAAKGDMLWQVKEVALLAPIPIAIIMFLFWLWRRPLTDRPYVTGLVLLVAATLLPWLPRIEGNYREVYWLAETQHEIPWYYAPYNGSSEPGGKLFWVSVSFPGLEPRYKTRDPLITVGKAVDFNNGKGGDAPQEPCTTYETYIKCEWRRGNFVYMVSTIPEHFPSDISAFMVEAANLLDGFEVTKAD